MGRVVIYVVVWQVVQMLLECLVIGLCACPVAEMTYSYCYPSQLVEYPLRSLEKTKQP